MALKDIPKFEKANNVSISVYGYQEGKEGQEEFVHPLKVTKGVNEPHVNLLLIVADDTNHHCFIKDFGKLVGSQYSSNNHKTYFCRFCLYGFSSHYASRGNAQHRRTVEEMEEKLKKHEERKIVVLHLLLNELNFQMILFLSLRICRSKRKHHLQFMQILNMLI